MFCSVLLCVLRLTNNGFVQCFSLRLPSPFAHVCLLCWCASSRKQRVCVVLFPSAPFPVCTCLFVVLVCFVSQTTGLCSAFSFGSLPRLHTFVMSMCFASQTPGLCCAVFLGPFGICSLYALFVLYSEICVAYSPCKLRVCVVLLHPSLQFVRFLFASYLSANFMFREFYLTTSVVKSFSLVSHYFAYKF